MDLGSALGSGRRPYSDNRPWTTGTVTAVDASGGRLEVQVDGTRSVLPRVDLWGTSYAPGDTVLIVRDPDASGSGQVVLGTIGASHSGAVTPSTGTVTAISGSMITVSTTAGSLSCQSITSAVVAVNDVVLLLWSNGAPWVVGKVGTTPAAPAAPAAPTLARTDNLVSVTWPYVAGVTAYSLRWSSDGGATWGQVGASSPAQLSIGQGMTLQVAIVASNSGGTAIGAAASITYPAPVPTTQQFMTTILPSWSGTYRSGQGWDQWNAGRSEYGGRSTLYQGSAHGSGTLTGLACYGTQLRDLGAVSIDQVTVTLHGASLQEPSGTTITVQGSPDGSQPGGAPGTAGSAASIAQPSTSATVWLELPADVRDGFRTGAIQGLVTNGGGYGAVLGTSAADGMALTVTYTRNV